MSALTLDQPIGGYPIATELTQQVIERRRLLGELAPCAIDSRYLLRYGCPSLLVVRGSFELDKPVIIKARKVESHG